MSEPRRECRRGAARSEGNSMKPGRKVQNAVSQFSYKHKFLDKKLGKIRGSVEELDKLLKRMEKKDEEKNKKS